MLVIAKAKTGKNSLLFHMDDGWRSIRLPDENWLVAIDCHVWLCTPTRISHHPGAEDTVSLVRQVGILPKKYTTLEHNPQSNTDVLKHMLHHCVPYKDLAPLIATSGSEDVRHIAAEQLGFRRPRGSTVNPST